MVNYEIGIVPKDSTADEIEDVLSYYNEDEETPEPAEYEEAEEPYKDPLDDLILTVTYTDTTGKEQTYTSLPPNPTTEQLKQATMAIKPQCVALSTGYSCGIHDNPAAPTGAEYMPKAGDELAMGSTMMEVVKIDGSGNGLGIAKVKAFNNAKFGVEFIGIKVKEGGCIYAGQAKTTSLDFALLSQTQREELEKYYAAYNTLLTVADSLAPEIARGINGLLSALQSKKNATRRLLEGNDITKLPEVLTNCTDIANTSKTLQDSLTKICNSKDPKKKYDYKKIQAQLDANADFMNKLGPVLAECQSSTFTPWEKTACHGPCFEEYETYTVSPECFSKIYSIFCHPVKAPNGKYFNVNTNKFLSHLNPKRQPYFQKIKNSLKGGMFGFDVDNKEYIWNGTDYQEVVSWKTDGTPIWGEASPAVYVSGNNKPEDFFTFKYDANSCGYTSKQFSGTFENCQPISSANNVKTPKEEEPEDCKLPLAKIDNRGSVALRILEESDACLLALTKEKRKVYIDALFTNAPHAFDDYDDAFIKILTKIKLSDLKDIVGYCISSGYIDKFYKDNDVDETNLLTLGSIINNNIPKSANPTDVFDVKRQFIFTSKTSMTIDNYTIGVELKNGKIRIFEVYFNNSVTGGFGSNGEKKEVPGSSREYSPNELVSLIADEDYTDNVGKVYLKKSVDVYVLPAAMVYTLVRSMELKNEAYNKAVLFTAVSLILPGGAVIKAIDFAVDASYLYYEFYGGREELLKSENGATKVEFFDNFVVVYGVGRVVQSTIKGRVKSVRIGSGAGRFVKDVLTKRVLKTIKKYDSKLGQMVEYPMYNNVALGKSSGGLKQFGDEVGANVWNAETDNIFTSMYDLMESRSFERNISDVFNQTLGTNRGKILFDVGGVNIQKAVTGGMVHNPQLVFEGFVTELELQLLMRNKTWFDNVIFHEGGKILNTQELTTKGVKFLGQ